jgi:hypothetical protein
MTDGCSKAQKIMKFLSGEFEAPPKLLTKEDDSYSAWGTEESPKTDSRPVTPGHAPGSFSLFSLLVGWLVRPLHPPRASNQNKQHSLLWLLLSWLLFVGPICLHHSMFSNPLGLTSPLYPGLPVQSVPETFSPLLSQDRPWGNWTFFTTGRIGPSHPDHPGLASRERR